jgi:tetratricopeptide (TPR) repeat protein
MLQSANLSKVFRLKGNGAGMKILSHRETAFVRSAESTEPSVNGAERSRSGTTIATSWNSVPKPASRNRRCVAASCAILVAAALVVILACVPTSAQVSPFLSEALQHHKAGRLKQAIETYTEVLKTNPTDAAARNWRGMAYADLGQLNNALSDYTAAIEVSPNYADALNNRGEIYRKKRKFNKALEDFRQAVQLDKKFAEPHYNMALVFEAQNKKSRAAAQYAAYLSLDPKSPEKKQIQAKIKALGGVKTAKKQPRRTATKPPSKDRKAGVRPGSGQRIPGGVPPGFDPEKMKEMMEQFEKTGKLPPGLDKKMMEGMPAYFHAVMWATQNQGVLNLVSVLIYLIFAFFLFLIARKTNTDMAWLAFIPIANIYLMVKIAGKPWWWLLIMILVPCVNVIFFIIVFIGIARARNKSALWGILTLIPGINIIAWAYLALSK